MFGKNCNAQLFKEITEPFFFKLNYIFVTICDVGKSESIERQTNTLLVLVFSWYLLAIRKI